MIRLGLTWGLIIYKGRGGKPKHIGPQQDNHQTSAKIKAWSRPALEVREDPRPTGPFSIAVTTDSLAPKRCRRGLEGRSQVELTHCLTGDWKHFTCLSES